MSVVDTVLNQNYGKIDFNGDVGYPVIVGPNKKISWYYHEGVKLENCVFKIVADDKQHFNFHELAKQVSIDRVKNDMNRICGDRNLLSEKAVHKLQEVRRYIQDQYALAGLDLRRQIIKSSNTEQKDFQKIDSLEIQNIIGIIGNRQSQVHSKYILCAHYDSYPGSPGLDDNASGVSGVLEVSRILSKYNFNKSIEFIAFDGEERGLIGSREYTKLLLQNKKSESAQILGVINLDMIGYFSSTKDSQVIPDEFEILYGDIVRLIRQNDSRGDFVVNIYNEESEFISDKFVHVESDFIGGLRVIRIPAYDNGIQLPYLAASDHSSFWEAGVPAIHIGNGGITRNPFMHSGKDHQAYVNVDYESMIKVIQSTVITLAELAEIKHSTVIYHRLSSL